MLARNLIFIYALLAAPWLIRAETLDAQGEVELTGVNLAGAEFAHGTFWPTSNEVDYFVGKGMNVFRLPFLWERLQPTFFGSLSSGQLNGILGFVNTATAAGAWVVVDPHNFARYPAITGDLIGSATVPNSAFADLWSRLANALKDNPRVIFGLMNEPHTMPTEQWRDAANAAIAAIRATGATNLILVPGNAWSGAHSWTQNWYGTSNSIAMLGIVDPGNHFAFELHQYFDIDGPYSGQSPTCIAGSGSAQLTAVTNWLRTHGFRGFLGEFAGADNAVCRSAIESALTYMDSNDDVWMGWTWWAAGPEWPNDYMFSLEPISEDRPQMAWLEPFLADQVIFSDGFELGNLTAWSSVVGAR